MVLLLTFFFHSNSLLCQIGFQDYEFDETKTYKITCTNGSLIVGTFEEKKDNLCLFKTPDGSILSCPLSEIAAITILEGNNIPKPKKWVPNYNASHYFLSPSAIQKNKKWGYYQAFLLTGHIANFSIADHFSFTAGTNFRLVPINGPTILLFPNTKFQLKKNLHAGLGFIYMNIPDDFLLGDGLDWKVLYGTTTLGDIDNNLTIGLGLGSIQRKPVRKPIFSISGMARMDRKTAIITENWIVYGESSTYERFVSMGLRFFGERVSFDLFIVNNNTIAEELEGVGFLPMFNFIVNY